MFSSYSIFDDSDCETKYESDCDYNVVQLNDCIPNAVASTSSSCENIPVVYQGGYCGHPPRITIWLPKDHCLPLCFPEFINKYVVTSKRLGMLLRRPSPLRLPLPPSLPNIFSLCRSGKLLLDGEHRSWLVPRGQAPTTRWCWPG